MFNFCLSSYLSIVLLLSATLLVTSCDQSPPQKQVDVVTSASPMKAVKLPPEGDTYEVLGQIEGIQNFVVKYSDNFYRGGIPRAEVGVKKLANLGIKTIVSIVPTDDIRNWSAKYGIEVIELPFEKKNGVAPEMLKKYLNVVKTGTGPFYTHCHGGSHRAGTYSLAYRIYIQDWDYEKALKEFDILGGDPETDQKMLSTISQSSEVAVPQ